MTTPTNPAGGRAPEGPDGKPDDVTALRDELWRMDARLSAAYDRADGALDLAAELRAENARLRAALKTAVAWIEELNEIEAIGHVLYRVGAYAPTPDEILPQLRAALEASHA